MTPTTNYTAADRAAKRNLQANCSAIASKQAQLTIASPAQPGEWLFGRDGYLTARDSAQKWLTGCSLPRRVAEELLSKLNVQGSVACFLAPTHAAQIRVVLDKLAPEQAVIAIIPDARDLAIMLACDNFSEEIAAHRLWFVAGDSWECDLGNLLRGSSGLSIPAQFIRLPTTRGEINEAMIPAAQKIFSDITGERSTKIRALCDRWSAAESDRLCVVAPSRFRLWNDVGHWISRALDGADWKHVDLDDPAGSSPPAIALAVHDCGAILTIDNGRADSPGLLSDNIPWLTWLTSPRIPAFTGAGKRDQLLVADDSLRQLAREAGWPVYRIHIADIPCLRAPDARPPRALAIIENTWPIDTPQDLIEFSSHLVLWETIAAELLENPFALGADITQYLTRHASRLEIATAGLDRARFVRELILPAYCQGIARALACAGLPIKLFGDGWDRVAEFAPHSTGAIATRTEFDSIVEQPLALIHVWPWLGAHAIDSLGKQVLRRIDNSLQTFVRGARKLLENPPTIASKREQLPLSRKVIENALAQARSDS